MTTVVQFMARGDHQLKFRVPEELKRLLEEAAERNNRSLNAEITTRLAMSFPNPELEQTARAQVLKSRERQIEDQVRYLTESLADIRDEIDRIKKGGD
jgi:hypothetical protein